VEDVAAWSLMAAAMVLIVVAWVTGLAVHNQQSERALAESAGRTEVRAVLLEDAQAVRGERGEYVPVQVPVNWTDRGGAKHTGAVVVSSSAPAGEQLDVWVDSSGAIVPAPTRPENAVVAGVLAAVGILLAGGTVLLVGWYTVRNLVAACNSRRWEREWAGVEPIWRRDWL
jgi:hypothetical protein